MMDRLDERNLRELYAAWERGRTGTNRGDQPRLFFLISTLLHLDERGVRGAVAEVGVYKGNSAKAMTLVAPGRDYYLLDTFGGFHEADTEDDPSGAAPGRYSQDLERVREFIGDAPNVHYCKGVFPETAIMIPDDARFALVHIDCDLYKPTMAACAFFDDRLNYGGMLIVHDYFGDAWPGVKQAVDEFLADKPEFVTLIPDKSGSGVICRIDPDKAPTRPRAAARAHLFKWFAPTLSQSPELVHFAAVLV